MIHSKIPLAQTVVQLCKLKNIKHIIISPGSRNAPLTIGFTNDDYFSCYSIVDERCAAFFALGIAQQIKETVAVVCTSGSALLNYYPAISEAFYSDIPLLVLSADRPKHLVNIGDGQTINQKNVFANHILYSANLKLDIENESDSFKDDDLSIIKSLENKLERVLGLQKNIQLFNESEIKKALSLAANAIGPVHINIPFDEPLYELTETLSVIPKMETLNDSILSQEDLDISDCLNEWNSAHKKMILVGVLNPNSIEQDILDTLANDNSVLVFTETTSNLHHPNFFPSIDKIIAPLTDKELSELQPDVLITFGGMVVSKKIKAFLRQYKPKQHWHIDKKKANDTFFSLTKHIKTTPNQFFSDLLSNSNNNRTSTYFNSWSLIKKYRSEKHLDYIKTIKFSDFIAFNSVLKALPNETILQLGNSSAVRYAQLFNLNASLKVFCNRGTSGIDGSTSTAIGCAVTSKKQTTLITGDLSFFYDSNALWNNYIPNNFRIIVINNQGGGIFRILPGHKNTEKFDNYFETTHSLTAKNLCDMHNFNYSKATNEIELSETLNTFFDSSESPKLLEIFTPRKENDSILLEYFNFIK